MTLYNTDTFLLDSFGNYTCQTSLKKIDKLSEVLLLKDTLRKQLKSGLIWRLAKFCLLNNIKQKKEDRNKAIFLSIQKTFFYLRN